jgi:1,4-alpha-glucan branching enzyme
MGEKGNGKKKVTFRFYGPEAGCVSIAGSFNNWDIYSHPLKQHHNGTASGVWKKSIYLPPGAHEYRFLVDGSWRNDPLCNEMCPNEFGSANCVIRV